MSLLTKAETKKMATIKRYVQYSHSGKDIAFLIGLVEKLDRKALDIANAGRHVVSAFTEFAPEIGGYLDLEKNALEHLRTQLNKDARVLMR